MNQIIRELLKELWRITIIVICATIFLVGLLSGFLFAYFMLRDWIK